MIPDGACLACSTHGGCKGVGWPTRCDSLAPRMLTSPPTTFGDLLRHHRQTAGLTQQELAERAGLSVHGIQKLERGATHPYRDTAQRLIAALHLDADDQDRFRAAVVPMRRDVSRHQPEAPADERQNLPAIVTRLFGRDRTGREV